MNEAEKPRVGHEDRMWEIGKQAHVDWGLGIGNGGTGMRN